MGAGKFKKEVYIYDLTYHSIKHALIEVIIPDNLFYSHIPQYYVLQSQKYYIWESS